MLRFLFFQLAGVLLLQCQSPSEDSNNQTQVIIPGAHQIDQYDDLIRGKRLGLCVNHTSLVNNTHLVDTLLSLDYDLQKIYTPEHGYRGTADAGEIVANDKLDQLEVISLYGKNKKPTATQLAGIDVMIFDLQDVGTRFFTYISTMHYLMEACAEANIPLIILDRPNPNDFIDGPVLDTAFRSFVGMHPIPIVHGLTVGELAKMIQGERWLSQEKSPDLTVISVKNWKHGVPYELPVKPSPNLPNQNAINWYPTLCFFEGTTLSVGRGTAFPFEVIGSPLYPDSSFSFTPISTAGAKYPKLENQLCYGIDFRQQTPPRFIDLDLLISVYHKMEGNDFFNGYFNTLAGNDELQERIKKQVDAATIRNSWQPGLEAYRQLRLKYLIYPDNSFKN